MMTEAQKRAQKKWDEANKENRVSVRLNLNKQTDDDIIAKLESVENKQGYIKRLIRRDLKMEQGLFETYAIIKIGMKDLDEEFSKPVTNLEYETVFKSIIAGPVIRKLDELKATDDEYSVEIYFADQAGEFIEGSDYDTVSNFIKRCRR
ncbi:MAG: hypothetical protein K6F53_03695 [Lachnospiraceae bacterium]|nr:hypothetical protein [Lachnospiraceae bacterium]